MMGREPGCVMPSLTVRILRVSLRQFIGSYCCFPRGQSVLSPVRNEARLRRAINSHSASDRSDEKHRRTGLGEDYPHIAFSAIPCADFARLDHPDWSNRHADDSAPMILNPRHREHLSAQRRKKAA